jgi:hypothetical protein
MNLDRTKIPASITTVEQLSAWCALALNNTHFQIEVQEAPGVIEKVADAQIIPILVNGSYEHRFIARTSFKIDAAYQGGAKLWTHVQPLSAASLPNDFAS